MKLLHYTYRKLSLLFFLLVAVWGILFYCAILEEVVDETDDTLVNSAHLLINQALEDPAVLDTEGTLLAYYKFRPITEKEGRHYKTRFYDDNVYVEIADEDEPVRVMKMAFSMPDGCYYELTLMTSIMEREETMEAVVCYLAILFLLFLIVTTIGIRLVLKGAYRPLSRLMEWVHGIHPDKPVTPLENTARVREFRELGEAVVQMANRSHQAYEEQKQFIENASHELQTPLAIVCGKIELLAESEGMDEQQLRELDAIYATLGRAVKLNKSLLLLSRIENGQFADAEDVSLDELIEHLLPDLLDIYEHKQVRLTRHCGENPFVVHCNRSLMQILLSNLLKNALLHNLDGGELQVFTTSSSLLIRNSGTESLDAEQLFHRFYHGKEVKKESTGLGLSIARSIAIASGLKLSYAWNGYMHEFSLVKEYK